MTTETARSLAVAIVTETINRQRLNVSEPIDGDPLNDEAAAVLWIAGAQVLHELIGSSVVDEETARATIAYISDMGATMLERLSILTGVDPFEILQRIALL